MSNKDKKSKLILVICNIILITLVLAAAIIYSRDIFKTQEETKKEDFIRTVESLKQVSLNYLDNEKGYVKDWALYISEHDMNLDEALDFLRSVNANKDRFIHIVDMDSYEAYSSYYPKGEEKIDTYLTYKDENVQSELPFSDIMQNMFTGNDEEFNVLGKYRLNETKAMAVGVGTKVTLHTENGPKDYLMLRIIPTDIIKKSWIFPTDYSSAEIGMITCFGDYVIQSSSMKSSNFLEYIRGYNFQNDYNERDALRQQLKTTNSGILKYKNFRGADCLWYYSSFGSNSSIDMLGMLDISELKTSFDSWYIIILVCGTLIVLALIDGAYLMSVNRKLRETARLAEQASKAKTQFLSAMSHDIRTPLNAVLGMMTIAQKNANNQEYVIDCMHKGIHSGNQLLTLINDVLDISKIESGMVTLNPEQVSLDELIHDLLEILHTTIEQKNIQLETDFHQLPYKYILADGMRLNQIYMNLLTNAMKYTNNNGKILLRLYEEIIPDKPTHTRLIFYIKDTGIGMTEEFQEHMYSTFTREVKTQVNSTQGTGLGLSIVKQMVDLMHGTIVCKSSPGTGTTFTVSIDFPIIESLEKSDRDNETSLDIGHMHLLVAEDNELNWEIISALLAEHSITCDRAENGKECLDMLTNAAPDTYTAILMDIQMPIMNGYETTKAIRSLSDSQLNKIIIVAMTADAFAEDIQACLNCGMNGHIAKPVDIDKLITYLIKIQNKTL